MKHLVHQLNERLTPLTDLEQVIDIVVNQLDLTVGLASSLGAEDQLLTDVIARQNPATRIFTLDTGRLPEQSYELLDRTQQRYPQLKIEVFFPRSELVETLVAEQGINLFYTSVESRRSCCQVRKLEPLKRALQGLDGWITGLRRDQSVTRQQAELVEYDEQHDLLKFNPLLNWSEQEVWDYIKNHRVPYNLLHDQGYRSIGCAPCSRAVEPGQDVRDGRWWWENPEHKECGLHQRR